MFNLYVKLKSLVKPERLITQALLFVSQEVLVNNKPPITQKFLFHLSILIVK